MSDERKKKDEKLVRKPSAFLYWFVIGFYRLYILLRYNVHCHGGRAEGPALVLSNHTSNHDYKFIASAHWPRRITFVGTYHWFTFRKLNFWLRHLGVIPKYQFAPDMASMKKIRYALDRNKALVFVAPEGTVYAAGSLGYMSPSIAKTIKVFRTAVYASKIEGAGLGNAKWSLHTHRGRIDVTTEKIITKEEARTLTVDEIMARITSSLSYDDFEYQKKYDVKVKGDDKLDGFDTMFYKCPSCGSEFTLTSGGNTVKCSSCGAEAVLDDTFHFNWKNTGRKLFDNYREWYDWQLEEMKKEAEKDDFVLEEEVDYAVDRPGIDNYVKVGRGLMRLTHSGWDYRGTYEGEEIEEHDDIEDVFLATLKIGLHFELPFRKGHCRVFYPVKNGKTSMKWHLASRALTELKAEGRI